MGTISFQCYSCSQVLRVGGEKAGKRGKCPKCGTALTIPLESSIADEAPPAPRSAVRPPPQPTGPLRAQAVDDDADYPPPRRAQAAAADEGDEGYVKKPKAPWGMAQIGLLIVFIAFCVVAAGEALGLVTTLLLTIMQFGSASMGMANTAQTLGGMPVNLIGFSVGVSDWLMFVGVLGAIAGYVLCILVPNKAGTRPLAITTTALAGVYFVLFLIVSLALKPSMSFDGFGGPGGSPRGYQVGFLIGHLLFCGQLIVFSLYLQAVLVARKKTRSANPMAPMVLACVYAGLSLIVGILCFIPPSRAMGWILTIVSWGAHGAFIAFLVQYILLIWNVRSLLS